LIRVSSDFGPAFGTASALDGDQLSPITFNRSLLMFVRWECGCRGLIIDDQCWVIKACDQDPYGPHEPLAIFERDMVDQRSMLVGREERERLTEEELREMVPKPHEPLPYSEVRPLLIEMNRLIQDGYAFRQMQSLISRQWQPIKEDDDANSA
jgi:hypothetical protein